jgi:hypothetical protein
LNEGRVGGSVREMCVRDSLRAVRCEELVHRVGSVTGRKEGYEVVRKGTSVKKGFWLM